MSDSKKFIEGEINPKSLFFLDLETGSLPADPRTPINIISSEVALVKDGIDVVSFNCYKNDCDSSGGLTSSSLTSVVNGNRAFLEQLMSFLENYDYRGKLVLVSHGCSSTDARVLVSNIVREGFEERFRRRVAGFLDTHLMFRIFYNDLVSYDMRTLVEKFLSKNEQRAFSPHRALTDSIYLEKLFNKKLCGCLQGFDRNQCTFSTDYAIHKVKNPGVRYD